MRVLVTGNLGFVGAVVTRYLQDHGHRVVGLDTGFFSECVALPPPKPDEQIIADVRDAQSLPEVDAVVHLAALSNDPLGELDEEITHSINVKGSLNIAGLAKRRGIKRFVFASSCSMYGISESGVADEESQQNPQTAYARSKVVAERGILALASDGFAACSLRFATAYGFSERPRLDIVVNNFIASAIAHGELILESDGTPWRPLVHVKDMARAILGVLEGNPSKSAGWAYNVGCGEENYQVRNIAELVSSALGGLPCRIGTARGSDTRSYRVSFERFADAYPEATPIERLPAIVSQLATDYSAVLTKEDFESIRFFRLRQINALLKAGQINSDLRWNNKFLREASS